MNLKQKIRELKMEKTPVACEETANCRSNKNGSISEKKPHPQKPLAANLIRTWEASQPNSGWELC